MSQYREQNQVGNLEIESRHAGTVKFTLTPWTGGISVNLMQGGGLLVRRNGSFDVNPAYLHLPGSMVRLDGKGAEAGLPFEYEGGISKAQIWFVKHDNPVSRLTGKPDNYDLGSPREKYMRLPVLWNRPIQSDLEAIAGCVGEESLKSGAMLNPIIDGENYHGMVWVAYVNREDLPKHHQEAVHGDETIATGLCSQGQNRIISVNNYIVSSIGYAMQNANGIYLWTAPTTGNGNGSRTTDLVAHHVIPTTPSDV